MFYLESKLELILLIAIYDINNMDVSYHITVNESTEMITGLVR